MFCAYTRPRYQVSVYRTIGPLVTFLLSDAMKLHHLFCFWCDLVRFNALKDLSPLRNLLLLFLENY